MGKNKIQYFNIFREKKLAIGHRRKYAAVRVSAYKAVFHKCSEFKQKVGYHYAGDRQTSAYTHSAHNFYVFLKFVCVCVHVCMGLYAYMSCGGVCMFMSVSVYVYAMWCVFVCVSVYVYTYGISVCLYVHMSCVLSFQKRPGDRLGASVVSDF